jgi:hypothetical protein
MGWNISHHKKIADKNMHTMFYSRAKADTALRIEPNDDKLHGMKDIRIFGEAVWIFWIILVPSSTFQDNMKT